MNQLKLPGVPARDCDPPIYFRSFEECGFVVVDGTGDDLWRELERRGLVKNGKEKA